MPPDTTNEDLRALMIEHLDKVEARLTSLESRMRDTVAQAFPGGDVDGHRRYHETVVEMLAEKRKLRQAVQEKTISGLVWSMIVFLALMFWDWVKTQLGVKT